MSTDVAVVILTLNEERNLRACIESVTGWAREVFVLDSLSTDQTVPLARSLGAIVAEHKFDDYGAQRNWALDHLPIQSEWVFFLDADEQLTPSLREEISSVVASHPLENGFFVSRKFLWMGSWVKRGYFPVWIVRLFRRGLARCESRSVNEHMIVDGRVGYLREPFNHQDFTGLERWVLKHNTYAKREAEELLRQSETKSDIAANFFGGPDERRRWLRHRVFNRIPPLIRPVLFFGYRFFLRGGFLDGPEVATYHVFQALWFPLLTDVYYLELKRRAKNGASLK